MTIADLAADHSFDPNFSGVQLNGDAKPWHGRAGKVARTTAKDRTRCMVPGCGVAYAPGRVCGYCRELVRRKRRAGP